MNPVITAQLISKTFGRRFFPDRREALQEVSLSVSGGESVALLGPNGAGKTTLHRILNGLLPADRGTATVLDCPAAKLGNRERQRIAFIAESQELPDDLTVAQAAAWLRPLYPKWDRAFERHLLQLFRLPERGAIGSFSRGMRMKTACLLSLSYHPEVLFLDEPFAGMDAVVRDEIVAALLGLGREEGWTLLLSSHDIEDVERLADRIALLEDGRLVLDVPLEDLSENCRRLTFRLPEGAAPDLDRLPGSWRHYQSGPRYASVVETAWLDLDDALEKARTMHPAAAAMEVGSLSLREIYLACLRPA